MNPRRIANSLATRLIVLGMLLVIFGAVARYLLLPKFLREGLIQVISAQQVALADDVARDVDYKIVERRRFLERLADSLPLELLSRPALLRAWLQARQALQPLFSMDLAVVDAAGRLVSGYPPVPGRGGSSLAGTPVFREARAGKSVIGSPVLYPSSHQAILPIAVPVKDGAGKVRAVLIGNTALDAPEFLDRLRRGRIGKSGGFLLVSPRDKLFIAASDPLMTLRPTPAKGINPLHDRAMAGFRGSGVTVNAQGGEEISAMASVPSTGWFVVARLPTAEAFAMVQKEQSMVMRYGFVAGLILFFGAGTMIVWLLRPLHRAADMAEKMTRGEVALEPLPVERDDEVGHLTGAFNRLLDKLANNQAELQHMAHHDALTGLPNRSLLEDRIQEALSRARRHGTQVALLFLDLDGFKLINDTLGHEAGDEALKEITRRLLGVLRQTDTLARVGGDEFVLLAADLDDRADEGARILANKCIDTVAQPLHLRGSVCDLGVSIGIVLCNGSCQADRLLIEADKAMYEAKQRGRGCYVMAPVCTDTGGGLGSETEDVSGCP